MSDIEPGTAFGEWQVHKVLGEGGFGTVVQVSRAHVTGGGATQMGALKIQHAANPSLSTLFDDEISMLTRLDLLPTPQLLDSGVTNGRRWFVMSLLKGESLDRIRVPLSLDNWKHMVKDLLSLLHELDKRGIAHRDIWPPNVFRLDNGNFTLVDFGVARKPLDNRALAYNRVFNAPEMTASGGNQQSDVFSVGLVLAICLYGPSVLESYAVTGDLPSATGGSTSWSDFLEAFLAHDPDDRPGGQELLREFELREAGGLPSFSGERVRSWLNIESAIDSAIGLHTVSTVTFVAKDGSQYSVTSKPSGGRVSVEITVPQEIIDGLMPHSRSGLVKSGFTLGLTGSTFETRSGKSVGPPLVRDTKDALRYLGLRLAGTRVTF